MDYWNKDTMGEALRWLIEDKLKLDLEKDNIKITNQFLEDNELGRLSDYIYKCKISLYDLVNMAYPNKFKEWEICYVNFWDDDKKILAIKWLVEDKLELTPKDLHKVRAKHFLEHGLGGLLNTINNSPQDALKLAYHNFT